MQLFIQFIFCYCSIFAKLRIAYMDKYKNHDFMKQNFSTNPIHLMKVVLTERFEAPMERYEK